VKEAVVVLILDNYEPVPRQPLCQGVIDGGGIVRHMSILLQTVLLIFTRENRANKVENKGDTRNPQGHVANSPRQGNQDQCRTRQGPQKGMDFFKEFQSYFLRLRVSDDEEPLVDEETETVGAINNTPVAATMTFRCPTLIFEPIGT